MTLANPMACGEGEHLIGYAYPSSPLAKRMGRSRTGCYFVQTTAQQSPQPSYDAAVGHVAQLGTVPQRWSIDHPLNAWALAQGDGLRRQAPLPATARAVSTR